MPVGNWCKALPLVLAGRQLLVRAAWLAFAALVVVSVLGPTAARAQFVVTNSNDSGSGSLRQAILDANAAGAPSGVPGTTQTITFAPGVGTITLQSALPPIYTNVNIVGTAGATIDGAGAYRGLFVSGLATTGSGAPPTINVSISNITIQNVVAQGGAGGSGGGGGGLGAGGALFVNQNANVTITNVSFANAAAKGGAGGAPGSIGGGGGGMGGAGGNTVGGGGGLFFGGAAGSLGSPFFGGGGGGITSAGSGINGGLDAAGVGGGGGGVNNDAVTAGTAGGIGARNGNLGGNGGAGGFGGGGGAYNIGIGGSGGFGGGGGVGGLPGNGGFGGGGAGPSSFNVTGGSGGFGGGGGGSIGGSGGGGGFAAGTGGSNGSLNGGGGGGAGLGGAVFVVSGGTLTVGGAGSLTGGSVAGGAAGGTGDGSTAGTGVGSGLFIQGNTSVTFAPGFSQTYTIANAIADEAGNGGNPANKGSLVMNGLGTLVLTAASTYTGGTAVTSGLINFNAANNFGSGNIALNGGGLQWAAGNTTDVSGRFAAIGSGGATFDYNGNAVTLATALTGTGAMTVANSGSGGALTLTAAANYSGPTIINSGATLALKGSGSIANSLYVGFSPGGSASGLDISQTSGGASVAGLFDPTGIGVVSLGAKTLTITNNVGPFYGVIQDGGIGGGTGGNLTIANGGLATFGSGSTYTGLTAINNGGELDLVSNGSIAHSKAVINNGIFDITGVTGGTSIASLTGANTGVVNLGINTLTITNASGTFAGIIEDSGAGSLAITGGKQTLTGINTYTGSTTVTGATLEVDGSIANTSSVTVNAGGTLSGTGIVDPTTTTIMSGGTLAPGSAANPTGTLTITGNLAFQSGAIYLVQVTPSAAASTNVSGTASLTGAVVNAQFASGNYLSKKYTILTAAGGLGGTTFAGITNINLPAGASDNLSYDANNVYLNLRPGFTNYTGLNVNQQNVANALANSLNTTGGIPAAFFGLSPGGLTQIDGEAGTGAERAAFQLTNQFLALMLDPFVDGRQGGFSTAGGSAIGFAPEQKDNLPPDVALAYASILTKAPPPPTFDQRWTAWGSAYGGSNSANGNATTGSNNITANTFGFAAGMDYRVTPTMIVGFALAGGGTNWGLANALGNGRSDALQAGVYGIGYLGPAYVAGALAFTNHWITTNRAALGDQLNANFDGQSYGARLESGYRVGVLPTLGVTPYGAVQLQDFHTQAYSESDVSGAGFVTGFGLSYAAMNATDVRTEIGSRLDAPTLIGGLPLILRGRVAWAHDFVGNPALSASFQTLPGASFTVNGAPIAHDSALTSAGAELFLTPRWTLLAKFDGEFANGSQTYAGSGTLRYAW